VGAGAGAQAPQQLVALLESARVGPGDARVARPRAGDGAVEIAPAERRRSLHDGQALGREDEDRGVLGERVEGCVRRAVDGRALRRARLEADGPIRLDSAQGSAQLDAGDVRADAHHARIVRGARRPRERAEVDGLEQARLAGAVAPHDREHLTAELAVDPVVAAEVRSADVLDAHERPVRTPGGSA
jgi:hypothetical protein